LTRAVEIIGEEKNNNIEVLDTNIYIFLEETFDKKFSPKQYFIINYVIEKIKGNNNLLLNFIILKKNYNFNFYEDYTNEKDVKEFINLLINDK
jgi:hypothetical protein